MRELSRCLPSRALMRKTDRHRSPFHRVHTIQEVSRAGSRLIFLSLSIAPTHTHMLRTAITPIWGTRARSLSLSLFLRSLHVESSASRSLWPFAESTHARQDLLCGFARYDTGRVRPSFSWKFDDCPFDFITRDLHSRTTYVTRTNLDYRYCASLSPVVI